MERLDSEIIKSLKYCEGINQNFTYNFVNEFINTYSSWENVDGIEGSLLDNYFVNILGNEEIFGVGFIEKYVNPNMSEYRVEVYDNAQAFNEAYNRTRIGRLECVVDKEDGERNAVNYLLEKLKEGVASTNLERELYNFDYLDSSYDNNNWLYLQLIECKEGNFKSIVIKALNEYISTL